MVTAIPNVTNWSVTPQNGQANYFTLMNTWLSESTSVIASLQAAITAQNTANSEVNTLAEQTEINAQDAQDARDEAVTALALLSTGAIDDTTIATNKSFSNSYIKSNYYDKTQSDNLLNNKIDTAGTGLQKVGTTLSIKDDYLTPIIATGTATFDAVTNSVTFSGLSIEEIENFAQVEIGDVLQYSNATDTKNNSEFTIEVLTQKWANGVAITAGQQRKSVATNITYTALTSGTTSGTDVTNDIGVGWEVATSETIIVNQAHANKGTSKNVVTRSGDTGVTVKLLAKWYNATIGLGQDWVNVTSSRAALTTYPNNTKRPIVVKCITYVALNDTTYRLEMYINENLIDQTILGAASAEVAFYTSGTIIVPKDSTYKVGNLMPSKWVELR